MDKQTLEQEYCKNHSIGYLLALSSLSPQNTYYNLPPHLNKYASSAQPITIDQKYKVDFNPKATTSHILNNLGMWWLLTMLTLLGSADMIALGAYTEDDLEATNGGLHLRCNRSCISRPTFDFTVEHAQNTYYNLPPYLNKYANSAQPIIIDQKYKVDFNPKATTSHILNNLGMFVIDLLCKSK